MPCTRRCPDKGKVQVDFQNRYFSFQVFFVPCKWLAFRSTSNNVILLLLLIVIIIYWPSCWPSDRSETRARPAANGTIIPRQIQNSWNVLERLPAVPFSNTIQVPWENSVPYAYLLSTRPLQQKSDGHPEADSFAFACHSVNGSFNTVSEIGNELGLPLKEWRVGCESPTTSCVSGSGGRVWLSSLLASLKLCYFYTLRNHYVCSRRQKHSLFWCSPAA